MRISKTRKIRKLITALILVGSFFFIPINTVLAQALYYGDYAKPINGTLNYNDWNFLKADFLNKRGAALLDGSLNLTSGHSISADTLQGKISAAFITPGDFNTSDSSSTGGNFSFPVNLGIGIKLPKHALDVSGNINFTGNLLQDGTAFVTSKWQSNGYKIYYNNGINGNVGIGTSNPIQKLEVVGQGKFSEIVEGGTPVSNQTNAFTTVEYVDAIFTSPNSTLGFWSRNDDNSIYYKTGNIGIGTDSPTSLLTLANNKWLSAISGSGTGGVNMFKLNTNNQIEVGAPLLIGPLEFAADSGLVSFLDMPITASSPSGTPHGYAIRVDGNNILSTYAESNGSGGINNARVGIGTATPSAKLEITGEASPSLKLTSSSNSAYNVVLQSRLDANHQMSLSALGSEVLGRYGANTALMTGNVGIGTTTPREKLHVMGQGLFDQIAEGPTPGTGQTQAFTTVDYVKNALLGAEGYDSTVGFWSKSTTGENIFNVNNGGVGINTGTPKNKLDVKGTVAIGSYAGVNTAPSDGLIVSGNVGIGTTNPSAKLDVVGDIEENGTILSAKYASIAHKYHSFSAGQYFFDDYGQGNYFRLFTENAYSDQVRFQPISDVEYYDGASWIPWVGGETYVKKLLDGRENTESYIDHTHRKFRFTVTKNSGWGMTTLVVLQSNWSAITYPGITLGIENWNGSSWIARDTAVFAAPNTSNDFGIHAKAVSLHDGYANSRVTIDINDWTDSGSYTTIPLKRFMILSQYSGNPLEPWRWNYDKEMSFLGALRVLGVTNSSIAGNLGIGTTAPSKKLHVNGAVQFDGVATGVTGTNNLDLATVEYVVGKVGGAGGVGAGIAGQTLRHNGTSWIADSLLYNNGSNVGINTAAPKNILDIKGSAAIGSYAGVNTAPSNSLIVSGNVGIGTTAPSVQLDVVGMGAFSNGIVLTGIPSGSSDVNYIQASNSSSTVGFLAGNGVFSASSGAYFGARGNTYSAIAGQRGRMFLSGGGVSSPTGIEGSITFSTTPGNGAAAPIRLIIDRSGNVGIGTTAPSKKLHVNGTVQFDGVATGVTGTNNLDLATVEYVVGKVGGAGGVGSGTTGQTLRHNGTSWIANSLLYNNGTNVGINTAAPKNILDIKGSAAIGSYAGVNTAPSDSLIVSGNVGIGTTAPASKLEVSGDTYLNGKVGIGAVPNSFGTPGATFLARATDNVAIFQGDLASDSLTGRAFAVGVTGESYVRLQFYTNSFLGFGPGNSTRDVFIGRSGKNTLRIGNQYDGTGTGHLTVNGNVGIGTTAPSKKLHVNGAIQFDGVATGVTGTNNLDLATVEYVVGKVGGAGGVGAGIAGQTLRHNGTSWIADSLLYNNGSNVGINTAAPKNILDIKGSAAIGSYAGVNTAPSDGLIVSGNVGIGKTNPSQKLDVTGNALVSGNVNANTLTVSGTGNSSFVGNVGIGTTAPSKKLHVDGTVQFDGVATGVTGTNNLDLATVEYVVGKVGGAGGVGSGTAGQTLRHNGTSWIANSLLYNNGSNVGINTATPKNILDIKGSAAIGSYAGVNTAPSDGLIVSGNVGIGKTNPSQKLDVTGNALVSGNVNANTLTVSGTGNSSFVGNVGIGTTAPSKKLHVNGAVQFDGVATGVTGTNNLDLATVEYVVGKVGGAGGVGSGTAGQTLRHDGTSWIANSLLYNNGSNVGINTATPKNILDIKGSAAIGSYAGVNTAPSDGLIVSGNVGIGKTNPSQKLDVTGNALVSGNVNANTLTVSGTGNSSFVGNVGIGTTAPSKKLHVDGAVQFDSVATGVTGTNNLDLATVEYVVGKVGGAGGVGSGTAGQTLRHNGTSWIADSNIFNNGVNVGIGTDSPTSLITIANNNWLSAINGAGTGSINMFKLNTNNQIEVGAPLLIGPLEFAANSGMVSFLDMPITASSPLGTPHGYAMRLDGNNILTVHAKSDGSGGVNNIGVGIGTASPQYSLDVSGSINFTGGLYMNGGIFQAGKWSSNGARIYYNDGNVGIGTTAPSKKLHVDGTVQFDGVATGVTGTNPLDLATVEYVVGKVGGAGGVGSGTAGQTLRHNGTSWIADSNIFNNGVNVGIGTNNPGPNKLAIDGGSLSVNGSIKGLGATSTNYLEGKLGINNNTVGGSSLSVNGNVAIGENYFSNNNAPANGLIVQGRLGVGTSTPAASLHVAGNARVDGGFTLGGDLNMSGNTLVVDKITANTIDPMYTISGIQYSTFASAIVGGVKEEYLGRISRNDFKKKGDHYELSMDMKTLEEGSDLWVWYRVIDFNDDNVDVFLSPKGETASMAAYVEGNKIVIRSDKKVDAYMRLIGKRFDWKKWPTKAIEQGQPGGLLIN